MNEINNKAAVAFSKYLENEGISKGLVSSTTEDGQFTIVFKVVKNISEKQLPLLEGKSLKFFSKNEETKDVKFLKLRTVAGAAEVEGSLTNSISGVAASSKEELEKELATIEERESRDHRKIGKNLDLFFIDQTAGKGLPIWLPNGVALKHTIRDFIIKQENKQDYWQVETPVIGSSELYKTSGHYYHYKEGMFPEMINQEKEEFILRPMACPHHVLVYKQKPRSYRELPIRIAEQVMQYRYEASGALIGLERVRAMELTDGHLFLREDQLANEIELAYELIESTLKKFNIEIDHIELALHDPNDKEKYHGDSEMWAKSEKILKDFLDNKGIEYNAKEGEAAFYGPKIDIQIKTALGHIITVSTVQLDFLLPERFDINYINKDNEKVRPIMIHRGHIGTYERFISVLLEQTKGDLPMWLAPVQAVIFPVNNDVHLEYANNLYKKLKDNGVRVKIDDRNERLSYKVREAQTSKIKTQIIIGDDEVKNNTVSYRFYGSEETTTISIDEILNIYKQEE